MMKGKRIMNKNEMLLKMLAQSGWKVTTNTDEDGYRVAVAKDEKERI
jgi:hypothetical protein